MRINNVFICIGIFIVIMLMFSCKKRKRDVDELKIELNNGLNIVKLYQGEDLKGISDKIFNSKKISINKVEKAVIDEGVYTITMRIDNKEFVYECQNEFWIYSIEKESFYRCAILDELRSLNIER